MDISHKKVCFLGDSITEGCGASEGNGYVALFGKAYPDALVLNYGIGGTRIARRRAPYNPAFDRYDFCSRVADMEGGADLVVVFGGTNDFGHGDAVMGNLGDTDVYTFYGALHTLFTELAVKYPAARFLVLTPLHRADENNVNAFGNVLKDYVKAIRDVAEYFSFPVLDLYAVSGMNPAVGNMQALYMPDGLHPNDRGAQRLYEVVDAAIKSL